MAFFSLFTSIGTLVCCAIPALFVTLGFGAALAGLVGTAPQLIWLSENKILIFVIGAALLSIGGFLQWHAQNTSCSAADPTLAGACQQTRDWSKVTYLASIAIYLFGAFFAFIAPILFRG